MKGILCKPHEVRAIGDNRKTQKRRVMKPQPARDKEYLGGWVLRTKRESTAIASINRGAYPEIPPYRVGEVVYVKETFWVNTRGASEIQPGMEVRYRADMEEVVARDYKWRSSLVHPAWAARYFLEITAVRAERLQDITEEDAKAEGAECLRWFHPLGRPESESVNLGAEGDTWNEMWDLPWYRNGFATVWEDCYGLDSWKRNDWVWVYEFKRVSKP